MPAGKHVVNTPAKGRPGTLATYGLPSLGTGALFGMLLMYFLKFSTDVLLIAPGVMGAILGASRLWDAVSDPLAGYWSDRTRTRLGRRRPWILASAVPIGIAFFALWSPPARLQGGTLVLWTAFWMFIFFTVYTAYAVPYKALGAELATGYHERTRVFATSAFLGFTGALLAIVAIFLLERSPEPRATAMRLAVIAGGLTVAAMLFAGLRLREQPGRQGRGSTRGVRAFADVWRNPHARPLLAVHFLGDLGGASFVGLLPYVSDYILKTPGYSAYYLLALLLGITIGIPIWVPLSRRLSKRRVWILAMALQAPFCVFYFFLREGDWALLLGGMFAIGFLNACAAVVAPSLQTDVIDFDEYRTGERKEGVYFASWNLLQKTAFGINLALVGFVLQVSGFQPNAEQALATKRAIGLVFAGLPCVMIVATVAILLRFRLDERLHARIRAALLDRLAQPSPGAAVTGPAVPTAS
jgi:GPH family glycoside/pentoside/hexuronide:cation symporter